MKDIITLDHGSGGETSHELVDEIFVSRLDNEFLRKLDDSAVLEFSGQTLAMTTDSYVVDPIFFPGGNIGSLAVHGTINDLAMQGAYPLYLTLGLMLEEGLPMQDLKKIIDSVAELFKVCEHVNLPFQAGNDEVLARMRRGYTGDQYRRLVDKIHDRIPDASLSTDLIVGFCGETEEQFQRTVDMVRDIGFSKVHAAAYSARPGTIADRTMADDVPQPEKRRRLKVIEELQEQIQTESSLRLLGNRLEVLIEGRKRGKWYGRTRNDKLVFIESEQDCTGQLVDVTIERTGPWSLQGVFSHERSAAQNGHFARLPVVSASRSQV